MKKYIALMLVFVMVLLAACNTAQPSTNTPTTTGSAATQGDSTTTPDGGTTTEPGTTTTTPQETTKPPETTGGNSGTDATENTTIPTTNPTDPTNPSTTKPTDPTNPPSTKPTTPSDYTLKLNTNSISLSVGGTYTLSYTYTGSGALSWKTSNSDVASVTNGRVTAIAEGTAVISVSDGVKTSQCIVTVTKKTEVVYTLSLSPQTVTLNVGESKSLTASYNGNQSLSWTTSNSSVATVSNGKVTAKAAGTAVITVKAGNLNAQCVVTVNAPASTDYTLAWKYADGAEYEISHFVVGVSYNLADDLTYTGTGTLSFSSSNSSVVSVDAKGTWVTKAAGTATITVTDSKKSLKAIFTVHDYLLLDCYSTNLYVGQVYQIEYEYSGNKALTWSSDNTAIAVVNSRGEVTVKAAGTANITVTNGSTVRTLKITVYAEKSTSIEEWNHNAPLYDGVTKYAGDYMKLEAAARPSESNIHVAVTSSDSSVVSVSYKPDSRNITQVTLNFKSAGTAKITITSADGNVSKSYTINVKGSYPSPHGYGQLTPAQFVDCYNAVSSALGMDTSYTPSGYLVLTLSDAQLTWAKARGSAESLFHDVWVAGRRSLVITYEGVNEDGKHIFYEHR